MDILNSNFVNSQINESFVNPSYKERLGLTVRNARGKLSLKDKIRLKLMKLLGRSRNGFKDKLQDKSLQAVGFGVQNAQKGLDFGKEKIDNLTIKFRK